MYPISAAVKALFDAEQPQVLRITGTDKNGTSIFITDANVRMNGFNIDRYSCNGSKLEIGTAIASEMTLKLDNSAGQYNDVVFEGTELFVEIGIVDWSLTTPVVTYIPCGYFTPDQQPRKLSTITIKAMDRMRTLDRMQPTLMLWTTDTDAVITDNNGTQIDFNAYVAFPTTIQNLVNQVCMHCGVTLATDLSVFPNYNYNLLKMPLIQQQFTYRNIIQWCAGFMGTNAWFDWNGQLRFSWYNNATGYTTDTENRYSSDFYEDDIEVTGIQYTNAQGVVILSGSADYALELGDNLMMSEVIAEVLPALNTALSGFTYRPMSAEVINAPYLWPMDAVTFEDKDENTYTSVLTNVNFGINGATIIESKGETQETNKYDSPTTMTPEQAKLINEAINHTNQLDASLNQEGIFNRLTNNGEAQGIYLMNGKLYINMTYARSGTLVLGGLDNLNGVLQVLDSNENVICTIDQNGGVMNGTFTTSYLVEGNTSKIECRLVNGAVEVYHDGQYVGKLGMDVRNDTVYGEDVGVYAFGSGTSASISAGNTDSAIEPPAKVSTNSSGSVYITGSSMYVSEYPNDIPQQCYTGNISANATLHVVNGLIVSYS